MHKFFCSFNELTQRYELTQNRPTTTFFFQRVNAQNENNLLNDIRSSLQDLYILIVLAKEKEQNDNRLLIFDETELLISNLYYSLFASPLELPEKESKTTGSELAKALEIISKLQRDINIPEYNRISILIRNNISSLL